MAVNKIQTEVCWLFKYKLLCVIVHELPGRAECLHLPAGYTDRQTGMFSFSHTHLVLLCNSASTPQAL